MSPEDIILKVREEVEDWKSRYEQINLEVSFWRRRHDILLQAMADSALTAKAPPMLLANKEAYELGRLHGAAAEREACAKAVDVHASIVIERTAVHNVGAKAQTRQRLSP